MALELRAVASRKIETGLLAPSIIPMEAVARALTDAVQGTPLELFGLAIPEKFGERHGFRVRLHPAGDPATLIEEQDQVHFAATTSLVGPGYHAFLIEALDAMQRKLGLQWELQGAIDRNFADLQHTMAQLFKAECKNAGKVGHPNILAMPSSLANIETFKGEVLTPFGPVSIEEIDRASALDGATLERASAGFYPWWGEGFDGPFFRGLALVLMWTRMRWAKPVGPDEATIATKALASLNQAVQLGVPSPVPVEVMRDFLELVGPSAPDFPRAEGIGYLRRQQWVTLDAWAVRLPKNLARESAPAGRIVLRNNVFRVQITTGTSTPGADPRAKSLAPGEVDRGTGFFPADDGNGFQLEAVARTPSPNGPDRLCLMKIWMADEKLRSLAEAIAGSVTLIPPKRG